MEHQNITKERYKYEKEISSLIETKRKLILLLSTLVLNTESVEDRIHLDKLNKI